MSLRNFEYMNPKWLDKDGNIKPNSWDNSSDNPTLLNVVYHFLYDEVMGLVPSEIANLHRLIKNKYATNGGTYKTNDNDPNPDSGFSLDESIAVAAASYKFGFKDTLKPLKIITKQTWFRFYDVVPFLTFCKYKWTHYLWLPQLVALFYLPWYLWILCVPLQVFVALSIWSSSLKDPSITSGKQLNYVQAMGLIERHWWVYLVWLFVQKYVNYTQAFSVYYPEKDHTINELSRAIWDWEIY